jgi:hypothetical protein
LLPHNPHLARARNRGDLMKILLFKFRRFLVFFWMFITALIVFLAVSLLTGHWKKALDISLLLLCLFIISYLIYLIYYIPIALIAWCTKLIVRKVFRLFPKPTNSADIKNRKKDKKVIIGIISALYAVVSFTLLLSSDKSGINVWFGLTILWIITIIAVPIGFSTARTERERLTAKKMGMTFREKGDHLFPLLNEFRLFSSGFSFFLKEFKNVSQKKVNNTEVTILDYRYGSHMPWWRGDYYHRYETHEQTVLLFRSERLNIPSFSVVPKNISYKIGNKIGFRNINFEASPGFSEFYLVYGKDEETIRRVFNKELLDLFEDQKGLSLEGHKDKLIFYRLNQLVEPEGIHSFLEEGFKLFELFVRSLVPGHSNIPTPEMNL